MFKCPDCGKENRDDQKFCLDCGKNLLEYKQNDLKNKIEVLEKRKEKFLNERNELKKEHDDIIEEVNGLLDIKSGIDSLNSDIIAKKRKYSENKKILNDLETENKSLLEEKKSLKKTLNKSGGLSTSFKCCFGILFIFVILYCFSVLIELLAG